MSCETSGLFGMRNMDEGIILVIVVFLIIFFGGIFFACD
jgi:hypothetical protein